MIWDSFMCTNGSRR